MTLSDRPYYIAPQIVLQLAKGKKKVLEADQDRIYIITGREGLGKSTLAVQLAYEVDPTLCLDDIVFSAEKFEEKIRNTKKFKAIVFDECFRGLSSKGSISKENKKLVQLLMECRQRNLFIFLVLPSFFLLEKYAAIFRSTALFHVGVSKKNFKRRYYKVYNYTQKRRLYIVGKAMMDYSKYHTVKSYRFYGKFPPTIDSDEYRKKKLDSFRNIDLEEKEDTRGIRQRNYLFWILKHKFNITYEDIEKLLVEGGFRLASSVIGRHVRAVSAKRQKTGGNI